MAEDAPYPLRHHFRRQAIPVLAGLLAGSVLLSLWGGRRLVESVYLELAQERADTIGRVVSERAPEAWNRLVTLKAADAVPSAQAENNLNATLADVLAYSRVEHLKIYDVSGRLLFSTEGGDLGAVETGPAMRSLIDGDGPQVVLQDEGGELLYELYVWWFDQTGARRLVMELYEPVAYLDGLIWEHVAYQILVPVGLGLALILLLWRMVERAQRDIDHRTKALAGVRDRLARLVSGEAVGAARRALEEGGISSRVVDVTLYHSDVRSFTGYAEETPPQEVVAFLNRVMEVQIRQIRAFRGDVDKMIGDALLAVFEGPDRADRAVACAQAVQMALAAEADLPRRLGIGLHDGFVISGLVGPEERQDFTVIGDAVNVSARLCGLATEGEVVADTRTLARAGHPLGFADPEDLRVKGRQEPLYIRRWRAAGGTRSGEAMEAVAEGG